MNRTSKDFVIPPERQALNELYHSEVSGRIAKTAENYCWVCVNRVFLSVTCNGLFWRSELRMQGLWCFSSL